MPKSPPKAPAKNATVYVVVYQLVDCCNTVGVFPTLRAALTHIEQYAIAEILLSGAGEYPEALIKHQELQAHIDDLQLIVRDRFKGAEVWVDMHWRESDELFQTAMFTITRHKIGLRNLEFGPPPEARLRLVHAEHKTVQ